MRVDLRGIDSRALSIDLSPPDAEPGDERFVHLHEAIGLRGVLEQSDEGLELSDVTAERAILESVRLVFGRILVELLGRSELNEIATQLVRSPFTDIGFKAATFNVPTLNLAVGDTTVAGRTALASAELSVHPAGGHVQASSANIAAFKLKMSNVRVSIEELRATPLRVGWGEAGFSLRAAQVVGRGVVIHGPGFEVAAKTIELAELKLGQGDVFLSGLQVDKLTLDLHLPEPQLPATDATEAGEAKVDVRGTKPTQSRPWVDWALLDELTGHAHVDVGIDMTLPVIGRRRAVHQLRVGVQQGCIDYRALESNLSGLEDALLDFSVRDDALVLELGIPLLPTRGMGKPLVRWPLEADEVTLAQEQRLVRLVTLMHPAVRPPSVAPPRDGVPPPAGKAVQLRALTLRNIATDLASSAPPTAYQALLRSLAFQALQVSGDVTYSPLSPDEEDETLLTAEVRALAITLDALPLGTHVLAVSPLTIGGLHPVHLRMQGVRPRQITATLVELSVPQVAFTLRSG